MLTLVQVVPPPSRADWFLDPSMGSDVAERRKPSSARYLVAGAAAVSAALIVVALVGVEFLLGVTNVILLTPIWLSLTHLALADGLWMAWVWLGAEIFQEHV